MKFTFKMFVLVGLILVGKFLKEDDTNSLVKDQSQVNQEAVSLKNTEPLPLIQTTNQILKPVTKQVNPSEKTFSYSLN